MNRSMKTITLDDEAYLRLKAWKRAKGDSFSVVVKRMVPEAGTLGAMEKFVSQRTLTKAKDDILEKSINQRLPGKSNPWI
jgi:predicted CopG family antitoxin